MGLDKSYLETTARSTSKGSVSAECAYWLLLLAQAPGGSKVRPNGRASSTSCAGLGGWRTFCHRQEV